MAQAADSPIGFRSAQKAPGRGFAPLTDRSLAELHTWQASAAGLAEAQMFSLAATIADLTRSAASPLGVRLLLAEHANLELMHIELGRLLSRLRAADREVAA